MAGILSPRTCLTHGYNRRPVRASGGVKQGETGIQGETGGKTHDQVPGGAYSGGGFVARFFMYRK